MLNRKVNMQLCVVTAPVNATVPCTNGTVRLMGGFSPYNGRVEICYNNQWGTVCNKSFTNIDASVVCTQLGYPVIGDNKLLWVCISCHITLKCMNENSVSSRLEFAPLRGVP